MHSGRKFLHLGKTIDEINVGDRAELSKTISSTDIYLYAGITGDLNPLYLDWNYTEKTHFRAPIAPGILTCGLADAVLANKLPGAGCITVREKFKFLHPVRSGDTITTDAEVMDVNRERGRITVKFKSYNQAGVQVLEGESVVIPAERRLTALEAVWEGF
ncbi:MAG: MaoC family dehydratase [Chloroflexi bacterium]|nr:MaoC family dehydratase [Chloroflexota bacterium]